MGSRAFTDREEPGCLAAQVVTGDYLRTPGGGDARRCDRMQAGAEFSSVNASRRNLLILGGVVVAILGVRTVPWGRLFGPTPEFEPLAGLAPFRTVESGGRISSASAVWIGLDPPGADTDARRARSDAVKADLCAALFNGPSPPGVVPIAFFSEFRCPYCRALERDLEAIEAAHPDTVRLVPHELPIFGPPSELAARASVAAARQDLQQPLRRRFMRMSLVPDRSAIEAIAAGVGIDTIRLASDMASAEVQADLDQTRALADVFGFIGTPGLVIGRTVLTGAVPRALIERIIEDERKQPPLDC
jgi:predicted DsbA family dithiol-disulfide isomerase